MLYQIEHATVSLGGETVLNNIHLQIRGSEKIAIVGPNGSGKTTLLKLISGELEPDADDRYQQSAIRTSRKLRIDMLRQNAVEDATETVEEHLLREYAKRFGADGIPEENSWKLTEKERFDFEAEYDRLFTGFGFAKEDKKRPMGSFSGGQQTRIAMIRLLLSKPDILLLDEPTNHLDLAAVEWLEDYLSHYEKAVVMVSHDRYFLDRVAEKIVEIRNGRLTEYTGGYSDYKKARAKNYAIELGKYREQQEEIARLTDLIKRFKNKPTKAAFARSRMKILERMEKIEEPDPLDAPVTVPDIRPASRCSKWVLEAEHLKFGYDHPLHEIDLRVKRGMKLGILGVNGSGKSTFLKTMAGRIPALAGSLHMGNGVEAAYYDQDSAALESDLSVIEYFRKRYPLIPEKDARKTLAIYGFGGRDSAKTVSSLSGGEKSRLVLCLILQAAPNLLILDEPTNHMDVAGMEMLERVLKAYQGTLLLVSHDRYFLDRTASSLLVFPKEGEITFYPFGYDHYRKRLEAAEGGDPAAARTAEEQALIEGLKAVPKGERHRLRELPTDAMYEDWRFRLVREQLTDAENLLEKALAGREEERYYTDPDYASFVEARIDKARTRATQIYLEWYDLVVEFSDNEEGLH